jgi:hypothetical protein
MPESAQTDHGVGARLFGQTGQTPQPAWARQHHTVRLDCMLPFFGHRLKIAGGRIGPPDA